MKTLDYLGLDEMKVKKVVDNLAILLADLQIFYSNLRGLHWNVKGHSFFIMHSKYEELYNDTATKVDVVAERILQLGNVPENRYSEYLKVSEISELGEVNCRKEAIGNLLDTYKTLIAREREIMKLASNADDETTVAIISDFLKGQEKTVWMLTALMDKHEEHKC